MNLKLSPTLSAVDTVHEDLKKWQTFYVLHAVCVKPVERGPRTTETERYHFSLSDDS